MSIFPTTDIISDVARAADPEKVRIATKRLSEFGATSVASSCDKGFPGAQSTRSRVWMGDAVTATIDQAPPTDINAKPLSAAQKFEAFLLQSWLENLLPKEGGDAYGAGPGANVWRSMMAEQLGAQLARAGGLGLNKILVQGTVAPSTINS